MPGEFDYLIDKLTDENRLPNQIVGAADESPACDASSCRTRPLIVVARKSRCVSRVLHEQDRHAGPSQAGRPISAAAGRPLAQECGQGRVAPHAIGGVILHSRRTPDGCPSLAVIRVE